MTHALDHHPANFGRDATVSRRRVEWSFAVSTRLQQAFGETLDAVSVFSRKGPYLFKTFPP